MQVLTCPLCCESQIESAGEAFERRWDHRPDENNVNRPFEVIYQHRLNRCVKCGALWFHGGDMKIDSDVIERLAQRYDIPPHALPVFTFNGVPVQTQEEK